MTTHYKTAKALRAAAREGKFQNPTAGHAPDRLQGNLVILPLRDARDFLLFCANNPKPCPLIGFAGPGDPYLPTLGADIDIRADLPKYRVYRHGTLEQEPADITALWRPDLVTFILGCSFTFESALARRGLPPPHMERGGNVPMFRTRIETMPSGMFGGPLIVSMRPYPQSRAGEIFDLCARYPHAHGAPVHWGDPSRLGIADLATPDEGEPVPLRKDDIPFFWACGVTPQAALERAKPGFAITHAPGHMLVTDAPSETPPPVDISLAALETAPPPA